MDYENYLIREENGELYPGDTTCSDCNEIICSCEQGTSEHQRHEMILAGRDYITQRLNGKRCHHKLNYVCETCGAEKRYFLNLMPKNKVPFCNGVTQKLSQG